MSTWRGLKDLSGGLAYLLCSRVLRDLYIWDGLVSVSFNVPVLRSSPASEVNALATLTGRR